MFVVFVVFNERFAVLFYFSRFPRKLFQNASYGYIVDSCIAIE